MLESPRLAGVPGLLHGFTTKAFAGEDLGAALGGVPVRRVRQVHGAATARAAEGAVDADAIVTATRGELVAVATADCQAVLVAALEGDAPVGVAAIHAGWRGAVGGVVEGALDALARLAPRATRRIAALGPAIGPCCFEVGEEVAAPFEARDRSLVRRDRPRPHADLPSLVRGALLAHAVEIDADSPPCTRCAPDELHSHRAGSAGRMLAFVGLAAPEP